MRIVVDMNLGPAWCAFLGRYGHEAVHWLQVGKPTASDAEIMAWARDHEHIVLTHDLDFGIALALTHAVGPSVVQIREQDVVPSAVGLVVAHALVQFAAELQRGALVTIDLKRQRARVLPLR